MHNVARYLWKNGEDLRENFIRYASLDNKLPVKF